MTARDRALTLRPSTMTSFLRLFPEKRSEYPPDEGIRFYFTGDTLNSLIIRPSGTSNSLRFHVQLHQGTGLTKENVRSEKARLLREARAVVDHLRELIGSPRADV